MKRFLSAVALCLFLLLVGLFSLLPQSSVAAIAKENILQQLLALPAPPPPNPLYKSSAVRRDEDFYSKKNPPKDDAPIEDILAYWERQSSNYQDLRYNVKPSPRTLDRIVAEMEKNPERLADFLNIMPETPEMSDFIKRIYDSKKSDRDSENWDNERIKKWLSFHSDNFSDELFETANQAGDVGEYVGSQDELLALVRVNWEKARPIVERLYNDRTQKVSPVLARWAFYLHALQTDSFGDIERYRDELKSVVEDKSATDGMRDLAFDALVKETDWNGRDDWYFSLLEDETLADLRVNGRSYTGLTTIVIYSSPEKYADKMIELLKSSNQAVRNAAVRNLGQIVDKEHPEIVKALLPWLENPAWAKEISGERRKLIDALQHLEIPESVPGLVAVLEEKQLQEVYTQPNAGTAANMAGTAANMARISSNTTYSSNSVSALVKSVVEFFPYRSSAVEALTRQKDVRAAAALRRVLPEVQEYERLSVVKALLVSDGFSISEQLEAIEFHAQGVKEEIKEEAIREAEEEIMSAEVVSKTEEPYGLPMIAPARRLETKTVGIGSGNGNGYASNTMPRRPFNPAEIKPILGGQIASNAEPNAEFLKALVERIGVLDQKDAGLAQALRRIMQGWRGAAVNSLLLADLKNNKLEIEAVVKLLSVRKELREKQASDISNIRGGNPFALGISACLLEDNSEYDTILASENIVAKTAMLGCARLIRAQLPIQKVAEHLTSQDKMLALAAESYLESEDSPEARRIVLSRHQNKAKILGARNFFGDSDSVSFGNENLSELFISVANNSTAQSYYYFISEDFTELETTQKKLQKEVLSDQELLGVYAYDDNFIRIYKDRAVFSWEEDVARYRERVLEKEEFDNVKAFLASQKVDELVPFLGVCEECDAKELLMLGRNGGRRIYVRADPLPEFFAELEKIFEDMRRPPAKLHYWLEKNIAGLEILFADDNLEAKTLWKNGADFRLLIANPERREQLEKELTELAQSSETDEMDYTKREEMFRQRREQMLSQHLAWYKFADGNAVETIAQPPLIELPPIRDGLAIAASEEQWKARTGNIEIRADEEGLYKKIGGQITKIREGFYDKPTLSANGRWAIVVKYVEGRELMRVNVQTGKEYKVETEDMPTCEPSVAIPSLNKILLVCGQFRGYYDDEEGERESKIVGENFLLDAETGVIQKAKGELRPLAQQTFRPLQPNGKADEFWAAIPDSNKNETDFGVYNSKTLTFKSMLKIPQIAVDSMNIWADEGERKIYLVYEGHLLSIPMK